MKKQFLVTNFAYGTGPYLRTTELAIAFNNELEKAGQGRFQIIVPLVYGEKQKKIMAEEGLLSDEIILDADLGKILNKAFFVGNNDFREYIKNWALSVENISSEANKYLKSRYGNNIAVELNRSPRISYNIAPSYFTSFVYLGEIFEKRGLSAEFMRQAERIEKNQKIRAIAYPATFSWAPDYKPRYDGEILVPPIGPIPKPNNEKIEPGVFVTKTGIPGLERLYNDAEKFGLRIYSNESHSPNLVANKNIKFHFARSGWSSVWLSLLAETPLVVQEFDSKDDPEIYFNNIAIEKMGIGIVYRGQSLEEILAQSDRIKVSMAKLKSDILKRWGAFDGTRYAARIFAEDFLKKP